MVYLLKLHQECREARVDAREFRLDDMVLPFGVVVSPGVVVVKVIDEIDHGLVG